MGNSLCRIAGITLFIIAWPLAGCDKLAGGNRTPAQADAPQQSATLPPPPIAPPVSDGPHPSVADQMAQHPAGAVMQQINLYKKRLEENPKDLEALIALGNANFDIQRFDQAKDLYLRALEIDPSNFMVRTDLATCYRNLGDLEQALKELNHTLSINDKHETALYNLGVILLNDKKDVQGAIRSWERLISAHPDVPYAADLKTKIQELKMAGAVQPGPAGDRR